MLENINFTLINNGFLYSRYHRVTMQIGPDFLISILSIWLMIGRCVYFAKLHIILLVSLNSVRQEV